jgi:hypothetical protein
MAAANDLCQIADLKAYLRRDPNEPTADDVVLARLISASSDYFRNQTGWDEVPQAGYTDTKDGNGLGIVYLDQRPILTVASVSIDGVPVALGDFSFTEDAVRLLSGTFTPGIANVLVSYTAGLNATPADVMQAVIEIAAGLYKQAPHLGQSSFGGTEQQISFLPFLPASSFAAQVIESRRMPSL